VLSPDILEVDLERQREAAQRRRFLERYFIEKHRIPNIGPGLKATLASYGIETAADVSSRTVSAVPGFGATRTKEILLWRQGIERRFAFDPAKGVDAADVRALDLKCAARRQELEQALRQGRPQLYALRAEAEQSGLFSRRSFFVLRRL
jgi:DNA-binding helix-hairpin-helix protein with protein kinase domain